MEKTQRPARIGGKHTTLNFLSVLAALLGLLWLLGFVTDFTMGGYLHVLLVAAIGAFILRIVMRRRSVGPK